MVLGTDCVGFGGMFIFPLTQFASAADEQSRFVRPGESNECVGHADRVHYPLSLPLIAAATIHQQNWFYPAFMIVVGAHYLPFIFLYGMWQFGFLAGILISAGPFSLGMARTIEGPPRALRLLWAATFNATPMARLRSGFNINSRYTAAVDFIVTMNRDIAGAAPGDALSLRNQLHDSNSGVCAPCCRYGVGFR